MTLGELHSILNEFTPHVLKCKFDNGLSVRVELSKKGEVSFEANYIGCFDLECQELDARFYRASSITELIDQLKAEFPFVPLDETKEL